MGEQLMKVEWIRGRVWMKGFIVGWNKDADDDREPLLTSCCSARMHASHAVGRRHTQVFDLSVSTLGYLVSEWCRAAVRADLQHFHGIIAPLVHSTGTLYKTLPAENKRLTVQMDSSVIIKLTDYVFKHSQSIIYDILLRSNISSMWMSVKSWRGVMGRRLWSRTSPPASLLTLIMRAVKLGCSRWAAEVAHASFLFNGPRSKLAGGSKKSRAREYWIWLLATKSNDTQTQERKESGPHSVCVCEALRRTHPAQHRQDDF